MDNWPRVRRASLRSPRKTAPIDMAKTVYCRMATAPTAGILATDVLRVGPFVRAMPPWLHADLARVDFQKAREFGESFDPEVEFWIAYLEENTGTRGALESALHMALERSREERLPSL